MFVELDGKKDLGYDATGSEIFLAATHQLQLTNASSIRTLVDKLKGLKIADEPGQDVDEFAKKVAEIATRIEGTRAIRGSSRW